MALVYSGIYSRPAGKTGGVVWGAARTRIGKVATARTYTIPNQPNTDAQLQRRALLKTGAYFANLLGEALYRDPWNNVVGLLPGFQSLMSHAINSMEYDATTGLGAWLDTPPPISLGPSFMPEVVATGGSGTLTLTWDTDTPGDHSADEDGMLGACFVKDQPYLGLTSFFTRAIGNHHRDAGTMSFSGMTGPNTFGALVWFRHTEPDGSYTYSPVSFVYDDVTT